MTTVASNSLAATPAELGFDPDRYPGWRSGQPEIIEKILDWYYNDQRQILMLEAPTGVGKSLIAAAVMRQLLLDGDTFGNGIITTTTLGLQNQYMHDTLGDMARSAWGRGNHQCLIIPNTSVADAPCVHGFGCQFKKTQCTYYMERDDAHEAEISVLNTAFYLYSANYARTPRDLSGGADGTRPYLFTNVDLAIHDEAHLLEKAVQGMIESTINARFFLGLGITLPRGSNPGEWHEWLNEHYETVAALANQYNRSAAAAAELGTMPDDPVGKQAVSQLQQMDRIITEILPSRPLIERTERGYKFRAIWGKTFAPHYLWRHARKHLLMSATIIHPDFIARSLGIDPHNWAYIEAPSPFAAMRRRIVYQPTAKVTAKTTDEEFAQVVRAMDDIISENHMQQKGIVHSVSYARAKQLYTMSRHRGRMIYHEQGRGRKDAAVEKFLAAPDGAILVSPAVGVGEDFGKGDNCRFQIFTKYPIPYMGDPVVVARKEDDPDSLWFEADMAFVQAIGRGMRSADDYCTSYVLDSSAAWRLPKLPHYIQDAVIDRRK